MYYSSNNMRQKASKQVALDRASSVLKETVGDKDRLLQMRISTVGIDIEDPHLGTLFNVDEIDAHQVEKSLCICSFGNSVSWLSCWDSLAALSSNNVWICSFSKHFS